MPLPVLNTGGIDMTNALLANEKIQQGRQGNVLAQMKADREREKFELDKKVYELNKAKQELDESIKKKKSDVEVETKLFDLGKKMLLMTGHENYPQMRGMLSQYLGEHTDALLPPNFDSPESFEKWKMTTLPDIDERINLLKAQKEKDPEYVHGFVGDKPASYKKGDTPPTGFATTRNPKPEKTLPEKIEEKKALRTAEKEVDQLYDTNEKLSTDKVLTRIRDIEKAKATFSETGLVTAFIAKELGMDSMANKKASPNQKQAYMDELDKQLKYYRGLLPKDNPSGKKRMIYKDGKLVPVE